MNTAIRLFALPCAMFVGVAVAAPALYVPTGQSNEVLVIDPVRDQITARIADLENAHALAATPDGASLVAGSMEVRKVDGAIDAAKPAAVSEEDHRAHHAVGAGPDNRGQSYLTLVDTRRAQVTRRIAVPGLTHHAAVSPDGKYAVAVHTQLNGISITDLAKYKVVERVDTGSTPNFAVFSADGRMVYVSNAGSGSIAEIDVRGWKKTRDLPVGKGPEHLVFAPDGKTLYVANVLGGTVSAVALPAGTVSSTFTVGKSPHGLDVSTDGRWLFVSGKDDGSLTRIDVSSGLAERMALAPEPYHVAYLKGLDKVYVSSRGTSKIWVVDPKALRTTSEIDLGPGAIGHQMVLLDQPQKR